MHIATVKLAVNTVLRKFGYQISKVPGGTFKLPPDFGETDHALWETVRHYTVVSPARIYSLRRAVKHVVESRIPGGLVECGVWKGGCAMAMALTLLEAGDTSRDLHLYDTYEDGWPQASAHDVTIHGKTADQYYEEAVAAGKTNADLTGSAEEVRARMRGTGYPEARIKIVKGKVEETIPRTMPEEIALLRLDTDWYESTLHEFIHLYPRLVSGGVLIIDDYAEWQGSRKATDEYFSEHGVSMLLHRIDDLGCRVGVKR